MTNVNVSLDAIRKRAEAALSCTTPEDFTNEAVSILEEDVPALLAEVERLQQRLSLAEDLLSEAHDMLDDVHCYETEIYEAISRYFDGGDSE
ncbi:hypothetical protein [Heyndrickxia oleronia]|uniref:Uncharacterized protein n=1 Tax=Heyndrickxia oleronia TaxID=38875 RepID=A0AAW6SM93_9BACI|nr:hypothetical protein [Heyndrickxia oleronia]MDH5159880.1 hypothetical protein [Heyndrickxia oleronia]